MPGVTNMNDERPVREIYVAIDPHRVRQRSLDIAVLIAERLQAGLLARLIADSTLHEVARLPFATEILATSGVERHFQFHAMQERESRQGAALVKLLAQRAEPRRVSLRLEQGSDSVSLLVLLEGRKDLFLPAISPVAMSARSKRRSATINVVTWLYDGSTASERCLKLLLELAGAGLGHQVNLCAVAPVPRQLLLALAEKGIRVCWMAGEGDEALVAKLAAGCESDLLLLTASYATRLGEAGLNDLNRRSGAPILVMA